LSQFNTGGLQQNSMKYISDLTIINVFAYTVGYNKLKIVVLYCF